jgi:biofilm PGA synthesis N-glycosyltransferase PgaC
MLVYFLINFAIYYIFILFIIYGWEKIKAPFEYEILDELSFISVVIAVRNEERNISRLLNRLAKQSFPKGQFEIIIVDDNSEDKTVEEIQKFTIHEQLNIKLLKNDIGANQSKTPKKAALRKGIEASKGDIIVMTDGDCWFGEDWLKSITSAFNNKGTMFVSGPVALKGNNSLLSEIQSLEFSSLIGSGAALIGLNYPLMCNGANLAFRKKVFYEVKGYEDNTSGDDVFLMQKIHTLFKKSIVFQKDHRSVVYTFPQASVSELIQQRKRWASKWNKYLLPLSWALPVFLFMHYVSFLAAIIAMILAPQFLWEISLLIFFKIILDYIILKKAMVLCKLRLNFWIFLLSEFLYPFYALSIGILVHFGNYRWKGRLHKV